jgi:transcriptional regulator of acetoin/glycerol metabolism
MKPAQVSRPALAVASNIAPERSSLPENLTAGRANGRAARAPLPPIDSVIAYRINDAAAACGLSRATLYRLMKEGQLRTKLVAGRRLIEPDALRELLSGGAGQ